jgi:hypothetical protein
MDIYKTKEKIISGTSYSEIYKEAYSVYKYIESHSKRKPYIRSKYFNNEKVFLNYFWEHLRSKSFRDRVRRLKYYLCALDLIKNSRNEPAITINPMKKSEILYRFVGTTKFNNTYYVQIKMDKKNQKFFMSVFPK